MCSELSSVVKLLCAFSSEKLSEKLFEKLSNKSFLCFFVGEFSYFWNLLEILQANPS